MSSVADKLAKKTNRKPPGKQVRLRLVYIDFWSAVKLSFLVAVCLAVVNIVASFLVFTVAHRFFERGAGKRERSSVIWTNLAIAAAVGWIVREIGWAVEVRIDDQGPGLQNTGNLFVPFFTTKAGGSGIGLVLSRQIAEGHGGSLTLENRAEERGVTDPNERARVQRNLPKLERELWPKIDFATSLVLED